MHLKNLTLVLFDTKENFVAAHTQNRLGIGVYKDVKLIENRKDFDAFFEVIEPDQLFILVCHVFHSVNADGVSHQGFKNLKTSGIEEEYKIEALLVSSGDSGEVTKSMYDKEHDQRHVYAYHNIITNLQNGKFKPYSKTTLTLGEANNNFLYGIITALYVDEFEEVKKHFTWRDDWHRLIGNKKYWVGHLNGDENIKIVACIPSKTGMVDSAIIATQMLEIFKPKYLMMSGVCGGKKGTNFGDIVLASKIFTFQKGKVSDLQMNGKKLELYGKDQVKIDYDQLYDSKGNHVKITLESFEREDESTIEFQLKDFVEPELKRINKAINETDTLAVSSKNIQIHFEPMACSTMVINKDGFFEDKIKVVDRKIVAVEMESYGVARACDFGNEGKTKWIIFKSVMDNMTKKDDTAKKFAAHTSALFLKHLIYDKVLQ